MAITTLDFAFAPTHVQLGCISRFAWLVCQIKESYHALSLARRVATSAIRVAYPGMALTTNCKSNRWSGTRKPTTSCDGYDRRPSVVPERYLARSS